MINSKQITNYKIQKIKQYDLEDRSYKFTHIVKELIKTLPQNIFNREYSKQLIRSSASIGANYIEANESLSKKDFVMRIKICKKETKETIYWLRLIDINNNSLLKRKVLELINEATQLMKIFGSIIEKCK